MRHKALSNDYGKNAKRNFGVTLTISFVLIIVLLILFLEQINKPNFDPISIAYILIPYSILSFTNMFFFVNSAIQRSTVKTIGHNRYLSLSDNEVLLEDKIDGRNFRKEYAWHDIKRIVVYNNTPFDKFNKKKTYTIAFILDDHKHSRFLINRRYTANKKIEYLNSFFYVMYDKDIINDIEKYWHGTVEELRRKPV